MKKLCVILLLVFGGLLVTTSGCQSGDEKLMQETPERLKTPPPESRSGPSEEFLPPKPEDE